jgi:hypothetical protein
MQHTPWEAENTAVAHLVKKRLAVYGIRGFITMFTQKV